MYWTHGGTRIITPTIPFLKIGTNYDYTFVLNTEAGEDLDKCYLCVATQAHVGLVTAKLSTATVYKTLKGLFNANCFLGAVAASSTLTVNFRINFTAGSSEGPVNIVVVLGHDDGALFPNILFTDLGNELWWDLDDLTHWKDLETH